MMTNVGAAPQCPPLGGTPMAESLKPPQSWLGGELALTTHTASPQGRGRWLHYPPSLLPCHLSEDWQGRVVGRDCPCVPGKEPGVVAGCCLKGEPRSGPHLWALAGTPGRWGKFQ